VRERVVHTEKYKARVKGGRDGSVEQREENGGRKVGWKEREDECVNTGTERREGFERETGPHGERRWFWGFCGLEVWRSERRLHGSDALSSGCLLLVDGAPGLPGTQAGSGHDHWSRGYGA